MPSSHNKIAQPNVNNIMFVIDKQINRQRLFLQINTFVSTYGWVNQGCFLQIYCCFKEWKGIKEQSFCHFNLKLSNKHGV